jgi:hypothetical protein
MREYIRKKLRNFKNPEVLVVHCSNTDVDEHGNLLSEPTFTTTISNMRDEQYDWWLKHKHTTIDKLIKWYWLCIISGLVASIWLALAVSVWSVLTYLVTIIVTSIVGFLWDYMNNPN